MIHSPPKKRDMLSLAEIHSLTPLLNSLFLEWGNYTLDLPYLCIRYQDKCYKIELKKFSKIGHHQYTGNIYLEEQKIGFNDFIKALSEVVRINDKNLFIERVNQSKFCIEEALKLNIHHFNNIEPNFKHTETALFVGHSLHPTPKSRNEFHHNDLVKYSPEHGAQFKVHWFKVHRSIYFQEHSNYFSDLTWTKKLSSFEDEKDYFLIPVHPWQKQRILELLIIKNYLAERLIIDLGEDPRLWTPTSSLRTIYNEDAPYMIKFSLDLKMTNSVRHLLPHELKRGIQIDEVCKDEELKPFFASFPRFKIIQEPLYAGILDENKSPIVQTLVMIRENPFHKEDEVSLLATLTQPHVNDGVPLLKQLINHSGLSSHEWFKAFLQEAIAPILVLQGQYGVLLGAHQQNLILKLNQGRPCGAYFRDCHGTGFDAHKIVSLRKNIHSIDDNNGNVLEQEVSHYLFAYYVIINTVFNTIAAISYQMQIDEEDLLEIFRLFLEEIKEHKDLDPGFVNYLLHAPKLKHKGNFFCTINNINENTAKNPLDIYTEIRNPLKEFYE